MSDLDRKVLEAMHRIEELYNETDGHCYVSFSGGKDSTVLLALIKMCSEIYTLPPEGIKAVYSNTGIELGVTVDFVLWCKREWYPNIEIIRPEKSFDWVLKNKGKPMKSKIKAEYLHRWHTGRRAPAVRSLLLTGLSFQGKAMWQYRIGDMDMHLLHDNLGIVPDASCCTYMKKLPLKNYAKENGLSGYMTGLRQAEGGARWIAIKKREKPCTAIINGQIQKNPIVDWTDENVEEFIEKYKVPLSDAYTKYGFTRTGCMACPFARNVRNDLEYMFFHEPNRYKASMHWLKDVYIAQNVRLPFDEAYERERERTWATKYEPMRQEMLRKYRPDSRMIKDSQQLSIFDFE